MSSSVVRGAGCLAVVSCCAESLVMFSVLGGFCGGEEVVRWW